jgi:hypothetical protein
MQLAIPFLIILLAALVLLALIFEVDKCPVCHDEPHAAPCKNCDNR